MKKFLATIVLVCFTFSFIFSDTLHAALELKEESVAARQFSRVPGDAIIPSSCGRITGGASFGSRQMVVNIQDLHCHPEVQRNIAKILAALDKEYGLKNVYVEGGYGDIDTSRLCNIKEAGLKKEIVENLIERGMLTGSEYFSVLSNRPAVLKGIEDEALHKANIVRLGKILARQKFYEDRLKELDKDLAFMEARYFSARTRRFNKLVANYAAGRIETGKYYRLLAQYVNDIAGRPDRYNTIFSIDKEDYPNITAYLELQERAKHIHYRRLSSQMQACIQSLKSRLPYGEYSLLLKKTDNFTNTDELYRLLAETARTGRIDIASTYPELQNFLGYVDKNLSLNPLRLLADEKRLVREIRLGLSGNTAELEVSFLADFYACFRDYLQNRLTADDYEYFATKFDKFRNVWGKYAFKNRIEDLSGDFPLLSEFYAVNNERNHRFLKNMGIDGEGADLQAVAMSGDTMVDSAVNMLGRSELIVVVTGGFHTTGLQELLREKRISYLSITPNVTQNTQFSNEVYTKLAKFQSKIFSNALALGLAVQLSSPELFRLAVAAANRELEKGRISGQQRTTLLKEIAAAAGLEIVSDENGIVEFSNGARISLKETDGVLQAAEGEQPRTAVKKQVEDALKAALASLKEVKSLNDAVDKALIGQPGDLIEILAVFAAKHDLLKNNALIYEISQDPSLANRDEINNIPVELLARFPGYLQWDAAKQEKFRQSLQGRKDWLQILLAVDLLREPVIAAVIDQPPVHNSHMTALAEQTGIENVSQVLELSATNRTVPNNIEDALKRGMNQEDYDALSEEEKEYIRKLFAEALKDNVSSETYRKLNLPTTYPLVDDNEMRELVETARKLSKQYRNNRIYSLGQSPYWIVEAARIIGSNDSDAEYGHIAFSGGWNPEKDSGPDQTQIEFYRHYLMRLGLDPKTIVKQSKANKQTVVVEVTLSGDSLKAFLSVIFNWSRDLVSKGVMTEDDDRILREAIRLHIYQPDDSNDYGVSKVIEKIDSLLVFGLTNSDRFNDRGVPFFPYWEWDQNSPETMNDKEMSNSALVRFRIINWLEKHPDENLHKDGDNSNSSGKEDGDGSDSFSAVSIGLREFLRVAGIGLDDASINLATGIIERFTGKEGGDIVLTSKTGSVLSKESPATLQQKANDLNERLEKYSKTTKLKTNHTKVVVTRGNNTFVKYGNRIAGIPSFLQQANDGSLTLYIHQEFINALYAENGKRAKEGMPALPRGDIVAQFISEEIDELFEIRNLQITENLSPIQAYLKHHHRTADQPPAHNPHIATLAEQIGITVLGIENALQALELSGTSRTVPNNAEAKSGALSGQSGETSENKVVDLGGKEENKEGVFTPHALVQEKFMVGGKPLFGISSRTKAKIPRFIRFLRDLTARLTQNHNRVKDDVELQRKRDQLISRLKQQNISQIRTINWFIEVVRFVLFLNIMRQILSVRYVFAMVIFGPIIVIFSFSLLRFTYNLLFNRSKLKVVHYNPFAVGSISWLTFADGLDGFLDIGEVVRNPLSLAKNLGRIVLLLVPGIVLIIFELLTDAIIGNRNMAGKKIKLVSEALGSNGGISPLKMMADVYNRLAYVNTEDERKFVTFEMLFIQVMLEIDDIWQDTSSNNIYNASEFEVFELLKGLEVHRYQEIVDKIRNTNEVLYETARENVKLLNPLIAFVIMKRKIYANERAITKIKSDWQQEHLDADLGLYELLYGKGEGQYGIEGYVTYELLRIIGLDISDPNKPFTKDDLLGEESRETIEKLERAGIIEVKDNGYVLTRGFKKEGIYARVVDSLTKRGKNNGDGSISSAGKNLKKSNIDTGKVDDAIREAIEHGRAIGLDLAKISNYSEEELTGFLQVFDNLNSIDTLMGMFFESGTAEYNTAHSLLQQYLDSLDKNAEENLKTNIIKLIKAALEASRKHDQRTLPGRRLVILLVENDAFSRGDVLAHAGTINNSIYIHINLLNAVNSEPDREALGEILAHEDRDIKNGGHRDDIKDYVFNELIKPLWKRLRAGSAGEETINEQAGAVQDISPVLGIENAPQVLELSGTSRTIPNITLTSRAFRYIRDTLSQLSQEAEEREKQRMNGSAHEEQTTGQTMALEEAERMADAIGIQGAERERLIKKLVSSVVIMKNWWQYFGVVTITGSLLYIVGNAVFALYYGIAYQHLFGSELLIGTGEMTLRLLQSPQTYGLWLAGIIFKSVLSGGFVDNLTKKIFVRGNVAGHDTRVLIFHEMAHRALPGQWSRQGVAMASFFDIIRKVELEQHHLVQPVADVVLPALRENDVSDLQELFREKALSERSILTRIIDVILPEPFYVYPYGNFLGYAVLELMDGDSQKAYKVGLLMAEGVSFEESLKKVDPNIETVLKTFNKGKYKAEHFEETDYDENRKSQSNGSSIKREKNLKKSEIDTAEVDQAIEDAIRSGRAISLNLAELSEYSDEEFEESLKAFDNLDKMDTIIAIMNKYSGPGEYTSARRFLRKYLQSLSRNDIEQLKANIKVAREAAIRHNQGTLLNRRLVILLTEDDAFSRGDVLAHAGEKHNSIYIHRNLLNEVHSETDKKALGEILAHEDRDISRKGHEDDIDQSVFDGSIKPLWERIRAGNAIGETNRERSGNLHNNTAKLVTSSAAYMRITKVLALLVFVMSIIAGVVIGMQGLAIQNNDVAMPHYSNSTIQQSPSEDNFYKINIDKVNSQLHDGSNVSLVIINTLGGGPIDQDTDKILLASVLDEVLARPDLYKQVDVNTLPVDSDMKNRIKSGTASDQDIEAVNMAILSPYYVNMLGMDKNTIDRLNTVNTIVKDHPEEVTQEIVDEIVKTAESQKGLLPYFPYLAEIIRGINEKRPDLKIASPSIRIFSIMHEDQYSLYPDIFNIISDSYFLSKTASMSDTNRFLFATSVFRLQASSNDSIINTTNHLIEMREDFNNSEIFGPDTQVVNIENSAPEFSNNQRIKKLETESNVKSKSIQSFSGGSDKEAALQAIAQSKGHLVIWLNGHGSSLDIELDDYTVIKDEELGDALGKRGNLGNVVIIIDACYSYLIADNLLSYLSENGIDFPRVIITAADTDKESNTRLLSIALNQVHQPGDNLKGSHIYAAQNIAHANENNLAKDIRVKRDPAVDVYEDIRVLITNSDVPADILPNNQSATRENEDVLLFPDGVFDVSTLDSNRIVERAFRFLGLWKMVPKSVAAGIRAIDERIIAPLFELPRYLTMLSLYLANPDDYTAEVKAFYKEHGYEGDDTAFIMGISAIMADVVARTSNPFITIAGLNIPKLRTIALLIAGHSRLNKRVRRNAGGDTNRGQTQADDIQNNSRNNIFKGATSISVVKEKLRKDKDQIGDKESADAELRQERDKLISKLKQQDIFNKTDWFNKVWIIVLVLGGTIEMMYRPHDYYSGLLLVIVGFSLISLLSFTYYFYFNRNKLEVVHYNPFAAGSTNWVGFALGLDGLWDIREIRRDPLSIFKNLFRIEMLLVPGIVLLIVELLTDVVMRNWDIIGKKKELLFKALNSHEGYSPLKMMHTVFHRIAYVKNEDEKKFVTFEMLHNQVITEPRDIWQDTSSNNIYNASELDVFKLLKELDIHRYKEIINKIKSENRVLYETADNDVKLLNPLIAFVIMKRKIYENKNVMDNKIYPEWQLKDRALYDLIYKKYGVEGYVTYELLRIIDLNISDPGKPFTAADLLGEESRETIEKLETSGIIETKDNGHVLTEGFRKRYAEEVETLIEAKDVTSLKKSNIGETGLSGNLKDRILNGRFSRISRNGIPLVRHLTDFYSKLIQKRSKGKADAAASGQLEYRQLIYQEAERLAEAASIPLRERTAFVQKLSRSVTITRNDRLMTLVVALQSVVPALMIVALVVSSGWLSFLPGIIAFVGLVAISGAFQYQGRDAFVSWPAKRAFVYDDGNASSEELRTKVYHQLAHLGLSRQWKRATYETSFFEAVRDVELHHRTYLRQRHGDFITRAIEDYPVDDLPGLFKLTAQKREGAFRLLFDLVRADTNYSREYGYFMAFATLDLLGGDTKKVYDVGAALARGISFEAALRQVGWHRNVLRPDGEIPEKPGWAYYRRLVREEAVHMADALGLQGKAREKLIEKLVYSTLVVNSRWKYLPLLLLNSLLNIILVYSAFVGFSGPASPVEYMEAMLQIFNWTLLRDMLFMSLLSSGISNGFKSIAIDFAVIRQSASENVLRRTIFHEMSHIALPNQLRPRGTTMASFFDGVQSMELGEQVEFKEFTQLVDTALKEYSPGELQAVIKKEAVSRQMLSFLNRVRPEPGYAYSYGRSLAYVAVKLLNGDTGKAYKVGLAMAKGKSFIDALRQAGWQGDDAGETTEDLIRVAHLVTSAELEAAADHFSDAPGFEHYWFTDLAHTPGQTLIPLGVKATVGGKAIEVYKDEQKNIFYIKTTAGDRDALIQTAAQISGYLGGTDNLPGVRKGFTLDMVIDHTDNRGKAMLSFVDENITKPVFVQAEEFSDNAVLQVNPAIRRRLIRHGAMLAALRENKILKIDDIAVDRRTGVKIDPFDEFMQSLNIFKAAGAGQLLVDWSVLQRAMNEKRLTRQQLEKMLMLARYNADDRKVPVHVAFKVNNGTTADEIKKLHDEIGFTSVGLDLKDVNSINARRLVKNLKNRGILYVVNVPAGFAPEDIPTMVTPQAVAESFDNEAVIDAELPQDADHNALVEYLEKLPREGTIVFHYHDVKELVDATRDITDQKALVSFLNILINLGEPRITTVKQARQLAYNWPVKDLPALDRFQLESLLEGNMDKAKIGPNSAIREQVDEITTGSAKLAFQQSIAGKMLVRDRLMLKDRALGEAFRQGTYKFDYDQMKMLVNSLVKEFGMSQTALENDWRDAEELQKELDNAADDSLIQELQQSISDVEPRSGAVTVVIDLLLNDAVADFNLKQTMRKNQEHFSTDGMRHILAAA